jgi:hypothetical protein
MRFPGVKRLDLTLLDDHQSGGTEMKTAIAAFAGLALAGIAWTAPAQAQGMPQGSYLRSCTDVRIEGDTLVARCRRADGREERTSLNDVRRCVGDIGNNNGNLQCSYGGPPRAQGPGPGQRYGETPGYGERRYGGGGYGSDVRERCAGLHREVEELRYRLEREYNPVERARTEGRLRELREQEERCR